LYAEQPNDITGRKFYFSIDETATSRVFQLQTEDLQSYLTWDFQH